MFHRFILEVLRQKSYQNFYFSVKKSYSIRSLVFAMARFPSIVSSSRRQTVAFFCISIAALVKFAVQKIEFVVSLEFLQNLGKQPFSVSLRIFRKNSSYVSKLSEPFSLMIFFLGGWMLFFNFFMSIALKNVVTLS